ncbi:nudC domain-containing protein 3 [Hetaerina americana]|uniref:nudC domain-containing protein 3 n=1 Tax=Hetaerina americana TaxID=62018 RepID=UPI003A7F1760
MEGKHDQTLMGVLHDEGQVIPFLDSMFGFLYRCTDFFRLQNDSGVKIGFPSGVAEQIVLKVLRKWEVKARLDDEKYYRMRNAATAAPLPINEVVVSTEPDDESQICSSKTEAKCQSSGFKYESAGDTYNGAERSGYLWSQTISDLDVQVTVPPFVTKAKQLEVNIDSEKLCVKLHNVPEDYMTENPEKGNAPLLEGDFCHKTKKGESTWTLIPGKEVQIHLEKCQERWWDALLTGEEKIDLLSIDASRPVDDLPQEEQMKIQEMMWAEQKKRMSEPNSQDQPVNELLKKAWNLEGSPFKGIEYNPSMINFAGSSPPY